MKKFGILIIAMVTLAANVFASEWWKNSNENVETIKTYDSLMELKPTTNSNTVIDVNYYIVEFEIKQSHFTLDISEHLKDSINKLTFEVPVDKDYYNKVRVGQEITDSFRMGSFVMKGSIGKWKITVKNKHIKQK